VKPADLSGVLCLLGICATLAVLSDGWIQVAALVIGSVVLLLAPGV